MGSDPVERREKRKVWASNTEENQKEILGTPVYRNHADRSRSDLEENMYIRTHGSNNFVYIYKESEGEKNDRSSIQRKNRCR